MGSLQAGFALTKQRANQTERGQAVVILALLLILLFTFLAVVIDGGNGLTQRRIVQNAADAGAMSGIQYYISTDEPTEVGLLEIMNRKVENHGVEDTDGIPGNEINDNVTVYYTDEQGVHLPGCNPLPCGDIPDEAGGVESVVTSEFSTFIAGVIGQGSLRVNANAIAIARRAPGPELVHYALLALGPCGSTTIDANGIGIVTGPSHSNSGLTKGGYSFIPPVITGTVELNPISFVRPHMYAPGGERVTDVTVRDLTDGGAVSGTTITEADLIAKDWYSPTQYFRNGVYFAGDNDLSLPNIQFTGEISATFVSSKTVSLGSTSLLNITSGVDDLLVFAFEDQFAPSCGNVVIDLSSIDGDNSGLEGLIYAPYGQVRIGDDSSIINGGVLAYSIQLNGATVAFGDPLFPTAPIFFDLIE